MKRAASYQADVAAAGTLRDFSSATARTAASASAWLDPSGTLGV